jgi:hypothetical protein
MPDDAAAEILTKSDFAARISRHPAFVTRAIEQGKLSGAALIGEGRGTRIAVAEALRQLSIKLDLGQQLAQASPIIPRSLASAAPPLSAAPLFRGDDAAAAAGYPPSPAAAADAGVSLDELELERADQVRLRNQKLRAEIARIERDDAVAAGDLVSAVAIKRALAAQLAPLVNTFDELPAAIAKPIADEFGLSYPAVLIAVKTAIRHARSAFADRAERIGSTAPVQRQPEPVAA